MLNFHLQLRGCREVELVKVGVSLRHELDAAEPLAGSKARRAARLLSPHARWSQFLGVGHMRNRPDVRHRRDLYSTV